MLLSSLSFFVFFLIVLCAYYIAPKSWQMYILLAASALFYLSSSVIALACVFVCALLTHVLIVPRLMWKKTAGRKKKLWVLIGVAVHIGLLAVTRYGGSLWQGLLQPLGIAYYSLMGISYIVDCYRGKSQPEQSFPRFLLYLMFFPLAPMGPVSRYGQLSETLFAPHPFSWEHIRNGCTRLLYGVFKKLVIADRLRIAVRTITEGHGYDGVYVLLLMLFFSIELYADFTGGIDIAIGCAEALGIRVAENFALPYGATSLAAFWNRWHISMGKWFTDYVFYPFSTSRFMQFLLQMVKGVLPPRATRAFLLAIVTLVTWGLTGLWHGAGLHFLLWGLMNGLILLLSRACIPLYKKAHRKYLFLKGNAWKRVSVLRTLFIVSALRLFDCYRDAGLAFQKFFSLFTLRGLTAMVRGGLFSLGIDGADFVIVCLGVALMWYVSSLRDKGGARKMLFAKPYPVYAAVLLALVTATLVFGVYGIGYDAADFLYTRY